MAESMAHRRQVRQALNDQYLQTALHRAESAYRKARAEAMEGFDLAASQREVRALKERSIADMEGLFTRFREEAEKVGAVVHEAAGGEEVADIVRRIAEERGAKLVAKSKSMLTEEIELNRRLEESGLRVVETDLGEWIIQLAGEKPSHFTAPALHKTREQIAELFSGHSGENLNSDVQGLVEFARRELRQAFIDADIGISGANIAIAETGGIVIVANEGNDRLVTTLPPVHIAVVGYEKLVPSLDDAAAILKVLSKSGTGQKQTAYVSFITGPSRTADIEKTLTLGAHGPKELHIIFVDAGRKAMAADEECREALYCIKCGACLGMCPVYRSIGGHAFGNAYMGGIGAVVTAFHRNLDSAEDTIELCTGCGYCKSICPSRIDIPRMMLALRKRLADAYGVPTTGKVPLAALRHPGFFQSALRTARRFQQPFVGEDGMVRELPVVSGLMGGKRMPGLAQRFLREILPERAEGIRGMTVSLYAGCMLDFIYPEIGESIWSVLGAEGVTAVFPHAQGCCGAPALYLGDHDTARTLAAINIDALAQSSPDYVVTGCPTCAIVLKEHFPALLKGTSWQDSAGALAGRVMDFSQFAAQVLNMDVSRAAAGAATVHDPCHQVRGLGTSGCTRQLLRRSGLSVVEMEDSDECCGFAGTYSLKQPGVSASILKRKIDHIEETGAHVVVTDCPGCIMQIRGGLARRGSAVRVYHSAEILGGTPE